MICHFDSCILIFAFTKPHHLVMVQLGKIIPKSRFPGKALPLIPQTQTPLRPFLTLILILPALFNPTLNCFGKLRIIFFIIFCPPTELVTLRRYLEPFIFLSQTEFYRHSADARNPDFWVHSQTPARFAHSRRSPRSPSLRSGTMPARTSERPRNQIPRSATDESLSYKRFISRPAGF